MPNRDDKRALLEAIAYGDDPRVTAADRIRAQAELDKLDPPERDRFREELGQMSPEQLEREGDALADYDPEEIAALVSGTSKRQPFLAAAIHAEVERRMREAGGG